MNNVNIGKDCKTLYDFVILKIFYKRKRPTIEFCKPAFNWVKDTGLPLVVNALSGVVSYILSVF